MNGYSLGLHGSQSSLARGHLILGTAQVDHFSRRVALQAGEQPAIPEVWPRRPFVGGNWKASGTSLQQIVNFTSQLRSDLRMPPILGAGVQVNICPPYVYLAPLADALRTAGMRRISIGAQNVGDVTKMGNYTGSVTPPMLYDLGVEWVMLGHSDRRNSLGETNEIVGEKTKIVLQNGMGANIAVGETQQQRDAGCALDVLREQVQAVAKNVPARARSWGRIILAYEPVWAIGDGASPCEPDEAQRVLSTLRSMVTELASEEAGQAVRTCYTGSVNNDNIAAYALLPDVDGVVLGRASLDPESLVNICETLLYAKANQYA